MQLIVERLQGSAAAAATLLSEDELARAARLRDPTNRERYVLAHAFLRRCLARAACVRPRDIVFDRDARGKPHVTGLHFSFARSGAFAAVAISARHPVGVDIEEMRPIEDVHRIAAHHFAPYEARDIAAAPDPLACFYRLWTRKEAVLKAHGLGITALLARTPPAHVREFSPDANYAGAVAGASGRAVVGANTSAREARDPPAVSY